MAYSSTGLSAAGGQSKAGNAPQLWTYSSADAIATVNTSGYFNSAASLLKVGDLIYVFDTTNTLGHLVYVNANSGTVVDVTDGLAVTSTDSD
jgi:hypothetical protein